MKKWIVELTHETMPARMQPQAEKAVHWLVNETLKKHELSFEPQDIAVHATPCRLVVMANVADVIAGKGQTFWGPRVDAPSQAVNGFMRQHGITNKKHLEQDTNKKGTLCYVFYKQQPQRNAIDCLPRVLEDILLTMRWQKSMRWGEGRFAWARPIRAIKSVYGKQKLKGGFFLGCDTAPPHYMETPHFNTQLFLEFAKLADGNDYEKSLKKAGIILARDQREKSIIKQVQAIANKNQLTFKKTNFEMMACLSENPVMLSCPLPELVQMPPNELIRAVHPAHTLPNEVIQAVCDAQYNIIPLQDTNNTITHVAFVTDNAPPQSHATIIEGYTTLLKARLADAHFYIKQDQKETLQHHAHQLTHMTFHADMGSMMDKTKRMATIIHHMTGMPLDEAEKMTQLAKADLTTQMVAEFPSLQGVIGAHFYSKENNHDKKWAKAMRDHYRPLSMKDALPASELGCVLALADKLETVVSFFEAGKIPTGSKDPYGLRRAAIGIARILIERLPTYSLKELIDINAKGSDKQKEDIYRFIAQQMYLFLTEIEHCTSRYVTPILIAKNSMIANKPTTVNEQKNHIGFLHIVGVRINGQEDHFANVYKRVCFFVEEAKRESCDLTEKTHDDIMRHGEETELSLFEQLKRAIEARMSNSDFKKRLTALGNLHEPLEDFCTAVKVFDNIPDVRDRRITLMQVIKKECEYFNDLCDLECWLNPASQKRIYPR